MANPFKLIRDAVAGPPGPQAMDEYVPGVDPNMDRLMRRGAYQVAGNGERGTYAPASFEDINRQQNSPPVPNAPWVPQQQEPNAPTPNLGQPPLDYRGVAQANTQVNAPAMLPPTAHQPVTDPYEQYAQAMHGPASQAYEKHLQQFPQYQSPGIFNKIVAGLGGASAGYFGGAGEGLKVGQAYLNAPYHEQISRWQQQNAPLAQAARIESSQAGHLLDPYRLMSLQQHREAMDKAAAERAAALTAGVDVKKGQLDLNKTAAKTPEERMAALEAEQALVKQREAAAEKEPHDAFTSWKKDHPSGTYEEFLDVQEKIKNKYTKPTNPGASSAREDTRLDKSYQYNSSKVDALSKPIQERADRLDRLKISLDANSPQADALIAPELLTAMAGGQGSGLRMNEAEISRIIGGRSNWEGIKASLNKWQLDPSKALSITPTQRQQIRALVDAMHAKVRAKLDTLDETRQNLIGATDVTQHRQLIAGANKKMSEIDAGGAPAASGPAVGTVQKGYRFKGGDPSKQENWEKVK